MGVRTLPPHTLPADSECAYLKKAELPAAVQL